MAKIVKQNWMNTVAQQYYRLRFLMALSIAVAGGLLWLAYRYESLPFAGAVAALEAVLLFFWQRRSRIIKAGAKGERETLNFLKQLPSHYRILPDVTITYRDHKSQVDYLIFTPGRIFLLECKNVSGVITGGPGDQTLLQSKIRQGQVYEQKQLYNPLRQAEGHRLTLQHLLEPHRLNLELVPAVYFCNPNAQLRVNYGGEHVYTYRERGKLLQLLLSDQNRKQTYPVKEVIDIITKK